MIEPNDASLDEEETMEPEATEVEISATWLKENWKGMLMLIGVGLVAFSVGYLLAYSQLSGGLKECLAFADGCLRVG